MSRTSTQHGAARIASALLACLMLTVLALPASAARVVDVRVGQHPTFTRVVFELDQMRGYRMARDAEAGVLIVSLDANATPESIASRGMVDRVVVEQAVEGAVARIHLKDGGANPRVQEMILGKPARIVLDIMKPDRVAKTPAPAPRQARKPTPRVEKPAPTQQTRPKPRVQPKPRPDPEPVKTARPPAPPPVAPKPALPVEPEPTPEIAEPATPEPVQTATPVEPDPEPVAVTPEPTRPEAPVEVARPEPEMPPASEETRGIPSGPMLWGGAGLLLAVGLGGFFWLRRRRAGGEDWGTEDDSSLFEAGGAETAVLPVGDEGEAVSNSRIPSGGFSMDGGPSESALPADRSADPFSSGPGDGDASDSRPSNVVSIFDTDAATEPAPHGANSMSDMMSDLPADPTSSPAATPPAMRGEGGGDFARMMEAMERRMSELESKLDEANEAREKLERQVAAQAEELRVQRAAIARTQRALRGMTRAGGDDRASEPALRDDTQARTRGGVA